MEKIIWEEKYSVGVKDLDDQHKTIFNLINQLIEAKEAKNLTARSESITAVLSKMTEYFWVHLDREEKYMKDYSYPEYEEHVTQHTKFKKKTMDINLDTMDHKNSVPDNLLIFLKEWWSKHILEVDMRYYSFFKEKGLK